MLVARVIGWADVADVLWEHLQVCCISLGLLVITTAYPHLALLNFVEGLQAVLIAVAFPLVGANLVGAGSFGLVYKGLLLDGSVVAIKRRAGVLRQDFSDEIRRLSEIWHYNVVTLIGYCQEEGLHMLVFEYLPNGSVCCYLYGTVPKRKTRRGLRGPVS